MTAEKAKAVEEKTRAETTAEKAKRAIDKVGNTQFPGDKVSAGAPITIQGRVVGEFAQPIPGATVRIFTEQMEPIQSVKSDANGAFRTSLPSQPRFIRVMAEVPGLTGPGVQMLGDVSHSVQLVLLRLAPPPATLP